MKRFVHSIHSLSAQMVLSLIAIVLLTALAAWLPEVWLIRDEFERQTWARVDQGRRAAHALYSSLQSEITNVAILTAQLPTLQTLLEQGTAAELARYLYRVESSLELDLVLVCDTTGVVAWVDEPIPDNPCSPEHSTRFHIESTASNPTVWLLSSQPVERGDNILGTVVVGVRLDDDFARQMRAETELEHTLLVDGQAVATSFDGGVAERTAVRQQGSSRALAEGAERGTFSFRGQPYYAVRLQLSEPRSEPRLEDEVALAATDIVTTQRQLIQTSIISVLIVIGIGSVGGVAVARRIGKPLIHLSQTAARFSEGDLTSTIAVETQVPEIALVAEALEHARIDLQYTVTTLQQEKAWVEHLLAAIVEGIVTLDDQERITFFSQGAERITGWRQQEVLNRTCDDVFRPTEVDEPFSALIPVAGGRRKIVVALASGQPAALSVTRAQLAPPEAGAARLALVFRDISEEEAAQRLLGQFLANVTHEFRTPLTALAASVELLLDQSSTLTPAELSKMLNWLHLGILGLQTLVDNLLESASLEAGRFQIAPHPADLGEVIAEATRLMQPLLEKYNQHLVVEMPATIPIIDADPKRVVQVLVNLLSNANKYGPEYSEIVLGVTLQPPWVRLTVADRGPGVPASYKDALFRRFAHDGSIGDRKQYGIGLGLWVVKAIVEAHGGQVGIEDQPGGGSLFWFTLPVAEAL